MQEMFKKEQIRLVKPESNEPVFKKQLSLIGEKGERAVNESPNEEEHAEVDPADTKL
jgi:hypothetical protein